MEDTTLPEFDVPEHVLRPLLNSANCSALGDALETLIKTATTERGRTQLASNNTILLVLQLITFLSDASRFLFLSLKLLRNLCAGVLWNQDSFITNNGVEVVSEALTCKGLGSDEDYAIVQTALQLLGNVSLAGAEHQRAIWLRFFPDQFIEIVKIQMPAVCDPLCMLIYTCCSGSNARVEELCGGRGLKLVEEIIRAASVVGFGEEWLKWLLSKVCFGGNCFHTLFYHLSLGDVVTGDDFNCEVSIFSDEQAFLLGVLSEYLNQQTDKISVSKDCVMSVLGILKNSFGTVDFSSRRKSGLPTGILAVDVMGYAVTILRDVCAQYGPWSYDNEGSINIVDSLLSSGLLELLLNILRDLEPPDLIKKFTSESLSQDTSRAIGTFKRCPYKGFRRDVVAVIGNCLHGRKYAQDEVRQRNGIFLLMQQCVIDEDNPFMREWGIWCMKNLFEGNKENTREVAKLELQGPVDVRELTDLGLRVEIDQRTGRPKLTNLP